MANRKKQPAHDPLSGPEEAAAIARQEAEAKVNAASRELKPLFIKGQLIGARYDPQGELVGMGVMGEVEIFRPNFDKVEQLVNDGIEAARLKGDTNA